MTDGPRISHVDVRAGRALTDLRQRSLLEFGDHPFPWRADLLAAKARVRGAEIGEVSA